MDVDDISLEPAQYLISTFSAHAAVGVVLPGEVVAQIPECGQRVADENNRVDRCLRLRLCNRCGSISGGWSTAAPGEYKSYKADEYAELFHYRLFYSASAAITVRVLT